MRETNEKWVKYVNGAGGETSRQLMEAEIPVPDAVVESFLDRRVALEINYAQKAQHPVTDANSPVARVRGRDLGPGSAAIAAGLTND